MKKDVFIKSSLFISPIVLVLNCFLCVLFSYFKIGLASKVFLFLFIIFGGVRLWSSFITKNIKTSLKPSKLCLFPNDSFNITFEIFNNKILPIPYIDIFIPFEKNLCVTAKNTFKPQALEVADLDDNSCNLDLISRESISNVLWYEKVSKSILFFANRRGVYDLSKIKLHVGDPFGLSVISKDFQNYYEICVFPKLINVDVSKLLNNLWNSQTGSKGIINDPTIIRQTREYQLSDNPKHINWRLLSREQGLNVNVFDKILPQSIHFIFDGESFSGENCHLDEMEETLSILSSIIVKLVEKDVSIGLSICKGDNNEPVNIFSSVNLEEMLYPLAKYNVMPAEINDGKIVNQKSIFEENEINENIGMVGHIYYITYSKEKALSNKMFKELDKTNLTILSFHSSEKNNDFNEISLRNLKGENDGQTKN